MPLLPKSLKHWKSSAFGSTLKAELLALAVDAMPLQHATTQGGIVDTSSLEITLISSSETRADVIARVGVFFTEIVGGCSCGDEPFAANAYCVLDISMDRQTANARITLAGDA